MWGKKMKLQVGARENWERGRGTCKDRARLLIYSFFFSHQLLRKKILILKNTTNVIGIPNYLIPS